MLPTKRQLLLGLAVCVVLFVAGLGTTRISPARPDVPVAIEGSFTRDGQFPGESYAKADGVRLWGSWSGSDDNVGQIRFGPFPAPRVLHLAVGGYPTHPGNALRIELVGTAELRVIEVAPVGERWRTVDHVLPKKWEGRPISVVAVDQGTGVGGWLAVSEPVRGGRSAGLNALRQTLAAWAVNGLLLGLVYFAALRWLLARPSLAPHWVPLGAGAIVAVLGYLVFWAFFASPLLGVITTWALFALAGWLVLRTPAHEPDDPAAAREAGTVLKLAAAVGAFYLAVLHLYPSAHDFYTLSANRFREALPGDNLLSYLLGSRLYDAQPVNHPLDEWHSSDRPPLQTGWQLLTWSAGKVLKLDPRSVSGTAAVWFQLLWVSAAYGLLRSFRIQRVRAAGWVAALALAGFFLQNTTFTWPKLAAGAFACGAFALLFLPAAEWNRRADALWAAGFAGLAWLTHGGVAFAFLPLVPVLAWRALRGEWRPWRPAAAVLLLLVLPWIAYQKFYDPPGTRLLKWHLGGHSQPDNLPVGQTIRDGYAKLGWPGAVANKVSNFHAQVMGDWRLLGDFSAATATERKTQEFFHTGRALTWWPVLAVFALVLTRRRVLAQADDLARLAGWIAATIAVWCLLMFGSYQAVVHQGSYTMMIGLFVLCSVLLERSGRGWLAIVAGLQAITLATTWAVGNAVIGGPDTGLWVLIAAGAVLAWFVGRATVVPPEPALPYDPETENGPVERTWAAVRRWWAHPRFNLWVLALLAAFIVLRNPSVLHTPQLWAEDGSIFLMQADLHGLEAFTTPYMGYLHTLPRLIAATAPLLLDPAWWPAFYNGVTLVIWLWAAARFFSPRFDFPGKPWLALSLVAVPHMGEVFFNVTNLQWVTALVLIQQVLIAPPQNQRERFGDLAIVLLIALTGPFGVAFAPLFLWRWWRQRDRDNTVLLVTVAVCAALQAWFVVRTGPRFEYQDAPWRIWTIVDVLARRLVLWPALGRDLAYSLPPLVVTLTGGGLLAAIFGWVLRPHPRRLVRAQVLAAFALITLASVYRMRPDAWEGDNLDFADRYFYLPRVLLAWLLIWEFDAAPRVIANLARAFCLAVVLVQIRNYTLPAPKDYAWAAHVEPIRQGVPANLPILPEGWTLEYRGRPDGRR